MCSPLSLSCFRKFESFAFFLVGDIKPSVLTLSPSLNQAKIGGFGDLQILEKGDEGIAASPRINRFVQNFTENQMVKSAMI